MTISTMTANQSGFNHVIAFEVSKPTLVVSISSKTKSPGLEEIDNRAACVRRLLKREIARNEKHALGPMLVVCEATGGYERHILDVALELGLNVHRAHGSQVRHFAKYRGTHAKTDAIDAQLLADFGLQTKSLRLYQAPSEEVRALRALRDRRQELLVIVAAENNRLEHTQHASVTASINRHVRMLKKDLAAIEQEIDELMSSDAKLAHSKELLQSVKGVGPKTAEAVLAYLPEIGQLSKTSVAALAGLAPFANDSGSHTGRRRIFAGRSEVRRCLHMAAKRAIQFNHVMRAFADRLTANGKPWKVVVTAVMRKLLVIMNAIMRDGEPWMHAKRT